MMAQKHLHELLQEDQEPFHLKNYIADRRPTAGLTTTLKINTRKPILDKRTLYKKACFLSFNDSPDVRKSPFVDFPSPAKSPCKSPNKVFLHIPAKTASILLDAAMRIQKHKQSSPKPKKSQIKNGLIGSILKKFRKSTEKVRESRLVFRENVAAIEMGFSGSCSRRESSTVWSESNEEKSSSSCSSEEEDMEFASVDIDIDIERENEGFSFQNHFCSSPISPFRFALEKSSFSGRRTPDFLSPAASPRRHRTEDRVNNVAERMEKSISEEEEEEKEQLSPVSVLDTLFEGGYDEDEDEDDDCAYATVQRANQQLLQKLHRFEKLAELGPIELEKIMAEEQDEDDNVECSGLNNDWLIREVVSKFSLNFSKIPTDAKRLISDLIDEELREECGGSMESGSSNSSSEVVERVCKRLEEWKGVEYNTIDMMVEWDIRKETEIEGWKKNHKQVKETEIDIEIAIFDLLLEELWEEL